MTVRETYPELVGMIHRLYEELLNHGRDYHHRRDPRLLMDVRELLVAVGKLPAPQPVVSAAVEGSGEAEREDETEAGAEGEAQ